MVLFRVVLFFFKQDKLMKTTIMSWRYHFKISENVQFRKKNTAKGTCA